MKYKFTLHKLKSNHNNLRTDIVEGLGDELPQIGECFFLFGKGLEFGMRMVQTTPIIELHSFNNEFILFKTKNSTYCVSIELNQKDHGPQMELFT